MVLVLVSLERCTALLVQAVCLDFPVVPPGVVVDLVALVALSCVVYRRVVPWPVVVVPVAPVTGALWPWRRPR